MKYRVLAICFLALIGLQPPSYAAVIKPGTYQMKWVYTPKQDRSEMSAAALKLAKATVEQRKSLKLVSEKALWGSQSGWTAALDESRGTGKGYDIAYVTCKRFAKPGWVTVPLIEDRSPTCEYKYHSDYNRPIPMDITIGPAESGRRRVKSAIGVDVHIDEGQSPRLNVRQYGYMEGSLRTDSGPLCVRLYDWNTTGIFGDVHGNPATIVLRTDGGKHAVAGTNDEQTQKVASVLLFDGKLYSLIVSPGGRSITVGRYAGPAGKLAVNAAIGSRQLSGFKVGVQAHLNEYWFQPKLPINLPPDELIFVHVQIDDKTELVAQRQVKITAGHTTTVSIGGPLALSIDSGNDQMVSAKAGGTARFYLDLSAGDDMYFVPQKATLSITGPDGQSVSIAPGVKDIQERMCDTIHLQVPSTWKAGDYKIDAKAEVDGQSLTASKTLRITDDSASQPQPPADSKPAPSKAVRVRQFDSLNVKPPEFKGRVKIVRTEGAKAEEKNGKLIEGPRHLSQVLQFDKDGHLVDLVDNGYPATRSKTRQVYTYEAGKLKRAEEWDLVIVSAPPRALYRHEYECDAKGNPTKDVAFYDGVPESELIRAYNDSGGVTELDYYRPPGNLAGRSKTGYDAKGKRTEEVIDLPHYRRTKFDYDASGNPGGYTSYDKDGTVTMRVVESHAGKQTITTTTQYTAAGHVVEKKVEENRQVISREVYGPNDSLARRETFTFAYDRQGNPTKFTRRTQSFDKGKPGPVSIDIVYRTITYYK